MFGIGVALLALIFMLGYTGSKLAHDEQVAGPLDTFNFVQTLGHIGVAMFVFEGNAVVINVRSECRQPEKYPKIMTFAIATTLTIFMIFAMVAYATFKAECNPIFTLNLVPVNGFVTTIIVFVCINAFISYPV